MRILAALDQSPFAAKVLDTAIALAKQQGASLELMTVAEDFLDMGDVMDTTMLTEKLFASAKAAAEKYAATASAQGIAASVIIEQGVSPADLIISRATAQQCDLVVMGHQGRSGLSRFLLGSVAARVVAHAPCSVLVVR
jgi:nucleotide-binding universal stress UspA family protein